MSNQEPCHKFCLPEYSFTYDKEYSFTQSCFPTGTRFCDEGFDYCDQPHRNTECECCGPRGRCCISCYICISPIGCAIDIITIPFRTAYCIYLQCNKCICDKCKCKNKDTRMGAYAI